MPSISIDGTLYTENGEGVDYKAITLRDQNGLNVFCVEWAKDRIMSNPTSIDPCIAIEKMSEEIGGNFCLCLARTMLENVFWDVHNSDVTFVAQDIGNEKQFVINTTNDGKLTSKVMVLNLDGSVKIEMTDLSKEEMAIALCGNKFLLSKL